MRELRWMLGLCLVSAGVLAQSDAVATPPPAEAPPTAAPSPTPPPMQPIPDAPLEATPPAAVPPPATAPLAPPVAKAPAVNAAQQTWFGVFAAVNVGLFGVDLHVNRSYTFLAGNLGVPLLSNGQLGAFAIGSGYSFPLSPPDDSMWVLDVFGVVNPGWQRRYDFNFCNQFSCVDAVYPFVGIGAGVGFRFLHWSGFTFGIKAPVFGAAINGGSTTSEAVSLFYLANLIGLPIVSFGFRW